MVDQLITEDEREQCKMMCNIAYPMNELIKTPMPRKIRNLGLSNALEQTDVSMVTPAVSQDKNKNNGAENNLENSTSLKDNTNNAQSNDDVKKDENLVFSEDSIGKLSSFVPKA